MCNTFLSAGRWSQHLRARTLKSTNEHGRKPTTGHVWPRGSVRVIGTHSMEDKNVIPLVIKIWNDEANNPLHIFSGSQLTGCSQILLYVGLSAGVWRRVKITGELVCNSGRNSCDWENGFFAALGAKAGLSPAKQPGSQKRHMHCWPEKTAGKLRRTFPDTLLRASRGLTLGLKLCGSRLCLFIHFLTWFWGPFHFVFVIECSLTLWNVFPKPFRNN